jgi:hypothetical protein
MRLRVAAPPRSEGYAVPMGGAVHREANVRVDPLDRTYDADATLSVGVKRSSTGM